MLKNCCLIIKKLFYTLVSNPVYFFKRIFFEIKYLILPVPKSAIIKKIKGVFFDFNFDYSNDIKRMYFGNYQLVISEILKKYLKKGDTFIDVGANIGYFSALAAGYVGKTGQVHSFEPVPEYFQKIKELVDRNKQYKIVANQVALGDCEKIEKFYAADRLHIGHSTFLPELVDGMRGVNCIAVPVIRLDKYIYEKNLINIKLIKIDVEGFEFPVLRGLSNYFAKCSKTGYYPFIVCEIMLPVYSTSRLRKLFDYMANFNYYPFEVHNIKKRINIEEISREPIPDILFKFCK